MTSASRRPPQQRSRGGDSRIMPKGVAGFDDNRSRLVELLVTPISAVFLAMNKNFATITFDNDVMARVTLAGMVDTTNPGRFSGSSIEDLHVQFRLFLTAGVVNRAQASSDPGYDIDITIDGVEYRMRFSVIAVL
ncbi:MAG: hypothetical protein RI947_929 [Candidatus Parcubacteria bacterium]